MEPRTEAGPRSAVGRGTRCVSREMRLQAAHLSRPLREGDFVGVVVYRYEGSPKLAELNSPSQEGNGGELSAFSRVAPS